MVTSFYIMKLVKNRKNRMNQHYSNLQSVRYEENVFNFQSKCRVCLNDGEISFLDLKYTFDIKEALKIFGNIEINESVDYPKYLCNVCFRFLKSAVSFRKKAQQTNEVLKQSLKQEIPEHLEAHNHLSVMQGNKHNIIMPTGISLTTERLLPRISEDKITKVQCPICKKVVKKSYYKTHKTLHDPNHQNAFECRICGKTFRLLSYYKNHKRNHSNYFPYKCNACPFKCKFLDAYKIHLRVHNGEFKYLCTKCPSRFITKSNFNRHHLLKHTEPQYKCSFCDKVYHIKLNLLRHQEVKHLGERPHVCDLCGKDFGYRRDMLKHQLRMHKREKLRYRFQTPKSQDTENQQL